MLRHQEANVDVGCVNLDSNAEEKSSSDDSYKSAEDEAYNPPPDGYELSSDSDGGGRKKTRKKGRTKIIITPTKKNSPKYKARKTPSKKTNKAADQASERKDDGLMRRLGTVALSLSL
ncbi:hypothetical protein PIB30_014053 [Stylosanthes scabra]|uniref:Uncharacterized protein n=1 Tax=Stylosanthes scabra TaxID=79078 RepID=A0ABU6Q7D4_9FABA|nr:hypothetical protein [Stylosanthes scabra]